MAGDAHQEGRGQAVEEHVDQVVAPRLEAAQQVVQAEGEDAQGSVGPVRAAVRQRGAPEVVVEEAVPWGAG